MTKTFSTLVAALAITASLAAATAPVSADTATAEVSRISGTDLGSSRVEFRDPISGTDLGSGRIADVTGIASGSGR